MTEQEILEKIKQSADEIEVPESLKPEQMKQKLEQGANTGKRENAWVKWAAAAAALAVCVGSACIYQLNKPDDGREMIAKLAETDDGEDGMLSESAEAGAYIGESENEEAAQAAVPELKRDAGELYTVAKDYGEIYDLLEENYYDTVRGMYNDYGDDVVFDIGAAENMAPAMTEGTQDLSGASKKEALQSGNAEGGFSKTNLQTEGVDESDIVKTDGSYIYRVTKSGVLITDVTGSKMKQAGEIEISRQSGSLRIKEMYVDGDTLNLILEKEKTDLDNVSDTKAAKKQGDTEDVYYEDVYYMDVKVVTELLTYDISDREKPRLTGTFTQDGHYNTSRKVGSIVYLFTQEAVNRPDMPREYAVNNGGWLPLVGGKELFYDCIYLPQRGSQGLVVASVDVKKPAEKIDAIMIIHDYAEVYVGNTGIYLYGSDYGTGQSLTRFAKFEYRDGILNAKGAGSVDGEVYDTFAINEYNGGLRILTTDWSKAERENNLYLFDKELNLTGALHGLAKGEQIYAARFLGDMAYFVTYRNTDPLFAVDLSDVRNPEVLSELKISGFSEYLHFWGEDKLLGIGFETDEETGARKGLKLVMFDISDPAKLKTLGSAVIGNVDAYSPALYNYKAVLVEPEENLIGFAMKTYGYESEYRYLLFAWENGRFKNLLAETLDSEGYIDDYRGLYIGDTFYIADEGKISSYDRKDGYKLVEEVE